jgi:uncharacterized protein (TIGR04255 family)
MAVKTLHPFADDEPGNIPLPSAPLVRCIAQVRFPHLAKFAISGESVAAEIARSLSDSYPLMDSGREVSVTITAEGVSEQKSGSPLWRLTSADQTWQVTFSGNFLSIETSKYARRSDFARRFEDAWEALNREVHVPYIDRLGVRYVNQVSDDDLLSRLPDLLRPEVLGVSAAHNDEEAVLRSSLCQAHYVFPAGGAFQAQWGLLPAGASLDPNRPPYTYPTWVLDMDSFQEWAAGSNQELNLYEEVRRLALKGYQFFRWAVTPEFLTAFGGQP